MINVLPSKTTEEVVAREWERKAKTTLLMALPKDHLEKFHMADAKEIDDGRRPAYQDDSKALVTIDGEDIDWSGHVEEDAQNYAMMAYFSSNSGSDNEVKSCSKTCEESYARLKNLYDEQRDKLSDASVEITTYTLELKKVEAQLLCLQQNQLAYEQKIRFMKIDLNDKTDVLTYHKKLLEEALKEKEDLKTKFENWQNSSKNLSRLLNTQMSANDKFGLGYGDYRYGSILSYDNEVLQSTFMNKTSANESNSIPIDNASSDSDSSVETTTSMSAPVDNAPKIVCEPKVWTDAPIIEEYESDSDDDSVSNVEENIEKPSFAFSDSVKHFTMSSTHQELASPEANGICKVLASPKQTALGVNTPRCDEDSIKLKELMVLCTKLSNRVVALEQSKTAQVLVIKKLQNKVKRIERKIKARNPGMTLFKIGNFRRKSLDKENVSKHERYLKTRPMFKESDLDNIDDMVDEDSD
nr:hypothetical protein [Tanacetum cinerariifolium]